MIISRAMVTNTAALLEFFTPTDARDLYDALTPEARDRLAIGAPVEDALHDKIDDLEDRIDEPREDKSQLRAIIQRQMNTIAKLARKKGASLQELSGNGDAEPGE